VATGLQGNWDSTQNGRPSGQGSNPIVNNGLANTLSIQKLLVILRRSWFWLVVIFITTNTLAYLWVRYTRPVYESSSEIKLELNNEAGQLGLGTFAEAQDFSNLSGEIELIRSRLFLRQIIDLLNLKVTYNAYGRVLYDERYENAPFEVSYEVIHGKIKDKPIDITLLNKSQYTLAYTVGNYKHSQTYNLGQQYSTPHLTFTLKPTRYFTNESNKEFFFVINSDKALENYLQNNLTVAPLNIEARTIEITFKDRNRFKARDLVNGIDSLYLKYAEEKKKLENQQKIAFLNEQLELTEQQLVKLDSDLENYTIKNRTTDLNEDLKSTLENLALLDSSRINLRQRMSKYNRLESGLRKDSLSISMWLFEQWLPEVFQAALKELDDLYRQKQQLGSSFSSNTVYIQQLNTQIANRKAAVFAALDQQKTALQERMQEISRQYAILEQRFLGLPGKATEYKATERYYLLYEEVYLMLMQKKTEFEIARAGTTPDFVILSSAKLPTAPIYPQRLLVYGIGVVTGLMFCFLLVSVKFLLNNKIISQSELEQLVSVPLLGIIPHARYEKKPVGPPLIVGQQNRSAVSEAFRSLRTNLDFILPKKEKCRIVSVTSTVSGEGKTFITTNLAGIISLSKQKVVVVDLDLRKPKVHYALGNGEVTQGLSTLLIGTNTLDEVLMPTTMENLFYIPAGPVPPNPSELILSEEMGHLLEKLKERFDVIMLDTPPVGLVTDGLIALEHAGLQIYVVRAEYTKRAFTKVLNRIVSQRKSKSNFTVILNDLRSNKDQGYGYGYGYGGYYNPYYTEAKPWYKKLFSRKKS